MEIRKALKEEHETMYLMGEDVWSAGRSTAEYLQHCAQSEKYKSGTWYVLTHNNVLLSSLVIYEGQFKIPENFCGIGSVATSPHYRNSGNSSFLINGVCEILKASGYCGVYLHSDIEPLFYKRLGFAQVSAETSKCMVRLFDGGNAPDKRVPEYF